MIRVQETLRGLAMIDEGLVVETGPGSRLEAAR